MSNQARRRDIGRNVDFGGRQLLEVRAKQSGDSAEFEALSGYGAVFYREGVAGTEYWLWNDLVERVMPGAFDEALKSDDVRSFFNHDQNIILGRRAMADNDTMQLTVDEIGLRYDVPFDAGDPDHVSVFSKVRAGKVNGSSFMFLPRNSDSEVWKTEELEIDGHKLRIDVIEIHSVKLFEAGPVVFPAYEGATSETRKRMASHLTSGEREQRDRRRSNPTDVARLRLRAQVGGWFMDRAGVRPE